jgi:chemotaxis protein MotB
MRRRRSGTTTESEGEGYLVSVSDLMVGLLFVFILILLAFSLQLSEAERAADSERTGLVARRQTLEHELAAASGKREALEHELGAIRNDVRTELGDEVTRLEAELRRALAKRSELLRALEGALRTRGVPVTVDAGTGVLRLADRILFASGRSDLPPIGPGADAARALAEALAETLPCYTAGSDRRSGCPADSAAIIDAVFVEGHTDHRRLGAGERDGNYDLSAARALTIYGAIQATKPELWNLRNNEGVALMGVSGYGPDRPVPGRESDREEDLAANRRIELRFLLAAPTPPELGRLRQRIDALIGAPAP